jgi:hypothetical protein
MGSCLHFTLCPRGLWRAGVVGFVLGLWILPDEERRSRDPEAWQARAGVSAPGGSAIGLMGDLLDSGQVRCGECVYDPARATVRA